MVKYDEKAIETSIRAFIINFAPSLNGLANALNEARISHYSSGCGTKSITFEIFPASGHIEELLGMLTLGRGYKTHGLKDASEKNTHNPAADFLLYMRRWSVFAEQVMQHEGASPRGVAAARAKLIIDDLVIRLGEGKPASSKATAFAKLMDGIGHVLFQREKAETEHRRVTKRQAQDQNYRTALAVAQGNVNTTSESDQFRAA